MNSLNSSLGLLEPELLKIDKKLRSQIWNHHWLTHSLTGCLPNWSTIVCFVWLWIPVLWLWVTWSNVWQIIHILRWSDTRPPNLMVEGGQWRGREEHNRTDSAQQSNPRWPHRSSAHWTAGPLHKIITATKSILGGRGAKKYGMAPPSIWPWTFP